MSPAARSLLCLVLTTVAVFAETVEFKILSEGLLEERLRLAHKSTPERFRRLKELFHETGCASLREQPVKGSKEPNLICTSAAPGSGPTRIIVGAHFDSAGGDGIIDNWTGAILLPSLEQFIREKPRKHIFEFVGFAAEEKGLFGSRDYLKSIPAEERKNIAAVITMDSLGLSPTKFWPNSSTRDLVILTGAVAQALKLNFSGVNTDRIGSTDSMTFFKAGVPVLSLHSVTQETWRTINSNRDVWKSVSWKDYYDTHRLVSALLVYLDQKLQ